MSIFTGFLFSLLLPAQAIAANDLSCPNGSAGPCQGLRGLQLNFSRLGSADRPAQLKQAQAISARFDQAHLEKADLRGLKAARATFTYANLTSADARGLNAPHANFRNAILAGARFTGAVLTDADFREADLRGAQLKGAVVTLARFEGAIADEKTDLPWPKEVAQKKGIRFK